MIILFICFVTILLYHNYQQIEREHNLFSLKKLKVMACLSNKTLLFREINFISTHHIIVKFKKDVFNSYKRNYMKILWFFASKILLRFLRVVIILIVPKFCFFPFLLPRETNRRSHLTKSLWYFSMLSSLYSKKLRLSQRCRIMFYALFYTCTVGTLACNIASRFTQKKKARDDDRAGQFADC